MALPRFAFATHEHDTMLLVKGAPQAFDALAIEGPFFYPFIVDFAICITARVVGPAAGQVIVVNTKGYTGHPMAVGLEDAVVVEGLWRDRLPAVANLTDPDSLVKLVEESAQKFGGLDILVNDFLLRQKAPVASADDALESVLKQRATLIMAACRARIASAFGRITATYAACTKMIITINEKIW